MIYQQTQSWCCHDCETGGTVIDWIMLEKNVSAAAAMQVLGGRNGEVRKSKAKGKIVATYSYTDESAKLLFQCVRFLPKDFSQRRPDGKGGWIWNLKGVRRVLYRLPEVIAAQTVCVLEGEKDADNLRSLGFIATTNPMGAGKWRDEYSDTLRGKHVVIFGDVGDEDGKGERHTVEVIESLRDKAKSIKHVTLPDGFHDISDYIASLPAERATEAIRKLIDETPEWTPRISVQDQTAAIRGQILSILMDDKLTASEQRTKIAIAVAEALSQRGRFFFHAECQDFDSAMFFDNERKRLERVRSDSFLAWLAEWVCINRADNIFKFIAAQIETVALAGKQTVGIIPESFWASRPGSIFLSNGDGAIARIVPGKVEIVDNGTDGVLFAVGNTLAPWTLTEPADPFSTCSAFKGVNCAAQHGLDLLRVWFLSLATNPPCKPPLCAVGDIGSGKTCLARSIAEAYGLPFVANNIDVFDDVSFWVSMNAGGLFTLDNCDTRVRWLADAVASAATAGCRERRKLYTNSGKIMLRAQAWPLLTTANPTFANDAGLADRLLVVRMKRRTDETSDSTLSDEIREHRNGTLSFITRTLSIALADQRPTPAGLNHRHPDFAAFAVRIGRAIGREAQIVAALKAAEMDKSAFCLENDTPGSALIMLMQSKKKWDGTAAQLLEALKEVDADMAATRKDGKPMWSAKRLGRRLGMLWPHLEKMFRAKQEKDRKGFLTYTLENPHSAESADSQSMI
jgi:hypothetical protein